MRKITTAILFSLFCFSTFSIVVAEEMNFYEQHMQELEQKKINREIARQEAIAKRNEQIRIQQEIQYRNQLIELQNQQIRNANRARQEKFRQPSSDELLREKYNQYQMNKIDTCSGSSGSFGEAIARRNLCRGF